MRDRRRKPDRRRGTDRRRRDRRAPRSLTDRLDALELGLVETSTDARWSKWLSGGAFATSLAAASPKLGAPNVPASVFDLVRYLF